MIAEFATIVGLLSAFSSGRSGQKHVELTEFLVWLTDHNHADVKTSIETNQATALSIKSILSRGLDDVHEKLEAISERLAILASRSEGIEMLAIAYANESISNQALEILKIMEKNGTEYFLISNELGADQQRLVLSRGTNYLCQESRFFQDDLRLMVDLGLLVPRQNSRGDPIYYYTRAASALVASIDK